MCFSLHLMGQREVYNKVKQQVHGDGQETFRWEKQVTTVYESQVTEDDDEYVKGAHQLL